MDLHDSFSFFLTQWCHLGPDLSRTGLLVLARVPCLHKACVAPMSVEEEFLPLYEELLKTGPVDAPRLAENTGLEPEEADLVLKCIADYLEEHNQKPPMKRPAKSEPKAKQSAAKRKAKAAPVLEEAPAAGCAETQLDRQDTQAVDTQEMASSPAADTSGGVDDDASEVPDKSPATTVPGDLKDPDDTVKDRSLENHFSSSQLRVGMFQ